MSTHNVGFYKEISKINTKLSSNTHLISSPVCTFCFNSSRVCCLMRTSSNGPISNLDGNHLLAYTASWADDSIFSGSVG